MNPRADAVILNPRANAGTGQRRWREFLTTEAARRAGLPEAVVFDGSGSGGTAALGGWVSGRLRAGARRFVAAGGDGTVHLALGALLAAPERPGLAPGELRLGAVGLGSSNDFHKPHGVEGRGEGGGLRWRLAFDEATAHDVGRLVYEGASDGAGTRHFLINASVGVTAEANWRFNQAGPLLGVLKRRWVDGAILATALRTFGGFRPLPVRLAVGASPAREVRLTNLGVVKNAHFSGQMRYDLPQERDDGLFGVHLCEDMGRAEMIGVLAALSAGRFQGRPKTSSARAARVVVEADAPFAVETDGEVIRARRAVFEALRREVWVCP